MANIVQVRSVEAITQLQASMNEHSADYVGGSTDKIVKFELWLDASELSTLDPTANEILDFSFNITWENTNLTGLNWGVTGDQLALDQSIVSYNYNNSSNIGFVFNPDNGGVASIAYSSLTASVDTKTPMFGTDQIGAEKLIATFYTNPIPTTEDTISLEIQNINIGTNLADSFDLTDIAITHGGVASNTAPTLVSAIVDASTNEGDAYTYNASSNFNDSDSGDTLTYAATLSNGSALPSWLSLNTTTGVLSGTPSDSDVGSIAIKVIATDSASANITDTYTLTISAEEVAISDTTGDDLVTGTANADIINAGIGRDVVDALGGTDTITLTGNTTHDGKFAHNVGSTTQVATDARISLVGKVKLETVVDGGADADTINLGSGNDAFFLHDSFSGFNSSLTLTTDTHTGAQGTQRIMNVETINGLGGDDIIDLTSPDYSLAGQVITINGGLGNDVIWGSDATETLIGGDGNDILFGGSGNDTLTGGAGADTFEFTRTAGSDTITDFQSGTDNIKLYSDYTFNVSKTDSTTADYSIDDQSDPTLYLVRGKTYTFEMSGNGHPFYIKSTDATSGTSDEYTDGVTRIGSTNSGSDGDKLQFIAGAETPDTLWYQCSAHSGMLGQINIVDKLSDTLQTSGNNLIWNTLTIQSDTAFDLDDVSFVAIA